MRRTNSSHERWNLVPIPPESKTNTSFRWWEVVIISYLVLLVLGLLVAGIADHRSGQNRQSNDLALTNRARSTGFIVVSPQWARKDSKSDSLTTHRPRRQKSWSSDRIGSLTQYSVCTNNEYRH
jgi:hypothetical protein